MAKPARVENRINPGPAARHHLSTDLLPIVCITGQSRRGSAESEGHGKNKHGLGQHLRASISSSRHTDLRFFKRGIRNSDLNKSFAGG
jgi:hypothetical protein